MKTVIKMLVILAIAFMFSSCTATHKIIQTAPCEAISIEKVAPIITLVTIPTPVTITKIHESIMFPFDSSIIVIDEMIKINKIVDMLKEYSDTIVVVTSYASIEGPEYYNILLSNARAESVKSELIAKGIDANRIDTMGRGETTLFGDLLKLNRRAVVVNVE